MTEIRSSSLPSGLWKKWSIKNKKQNLYLMVVLISFNPRISLRVDLKIFKGRVTEFLV